MVIDFERRTTDTLGGLMLKLTPTEYRVLAELAAKCESGVDPRTAFAPNMAQ